jgi:hypothetical protein
MGKGNRTNIFFKEYCMATGIYQKLQEQLDRYSVGFPITAWYGGRER